MFVKVVLNVVCVWNVMKGVLLKNCMIGSVSFIMWYFKCSLDMGFIKVLDIRILLGFSMVCVCDSIEGKFLIRCRMLCVSIILYGLLGIFLVLWILKEMLLMLLF